MMYSAYKLNKQGEKIQLWHTPFPIWNQSVVPCPVLTVASWPAYRFLKRQVRWYGIPISFISHASKVMLKILQARLQQYVNRELPDVQAGFRKVRGTRDQITNICWIIKKAREFQKKIYFCFIDYAKAFDCVDRDKLWKILIEAWILGGCNSILFPFLQNIFSGPDSENEWPHIDTKRTLYILP